MSQSVQYITNESGTRVGVLLDLDTYRQLTSTTQNSELLVGLSNEELTALSETALSQVTQARLDDFLTRNTENQLSEAEQAQLDQLLQKIDSLNVLKTRARYTLHATL
ncbi:MAG: hypothetical protein WBC73_15135 [Phormidesmis sp.]